MTGHCDVEVLAEFREGLLGRRRSARIRAHLAACPDCASVSDGLAEVRTLLASAPAPRMPDELAARLDTVLAAEAAARALAADSPAAADSRAAAAGAGPDGHWTASGSNGAGQNGRDHGRRSGSARPARPPRPWRVTALRAASVTAAVLVIAGGGYGVSRVLQGGGPSSSSGASAARGSQTGGPVHGTRAGGGKQVHQNSTGPPNITLPRTLPVVRSGTDYRPGRLSAEAAAELAHHGRYVANTVAPLDMDQLRGCVLRVTGGVKPSLVDLASYQGRPARIIMEAGTSGRSGRVWVVASSCSSARPDVIAQARLTGTG